MSRHPAKSEELSSRNWAGKVAAALVPGFTASLALTCLYLQLAGVQDSFMSAHGQIAMWAMAPLWSGILSSCFLFRTGLRAWSWLLLANLVLWGAYAALNWLSA